ncbi:hypothetical protein C0J52_24040 [Blattella germanica]|nr:hypothetical protein C0J52_24040 [Blattella germanica]
MINSYEERWRDLAPTISIKTLQNRETSEPEVNFCRKRFHIQHHKRILKEHYTHAVGCIQRRCAKQSLPQVREEHSAHHRLPEEDKFLESYHREKTRDERQLARLQAHEKSRDMPGRGLICIDTDLLSHMQKIPITEEESMEMIESQLFTMDLRTKKMDNYSSIYYMSSVWCLKYSSMQCNC